MLKPRFWIVGVTLALVCAACSNARDERESLANPRNAGPSFTAIPSSFPQYLLFKDGGLIRLTDNGGNDVMKVSIYKSLSDVEAYCQGGNGATFDKPAKRLVKVIFYQNISTAQGLSEWCNPVVSVAAPDGSWSGWVPRIVTAPNLPIGAKLVVENGGLDQPNIWETPDGNHTSFNVSGGTTLRYLGFDDNPSDTEYHVRVMSGPHKGKSGWTDATFLRAENGDVIAMYESPEAAKKGNTPGGGEADTSSATESQPTPTPEAAQQNNEREPDVAALDERAEDQYQRANNIVRNTPPDSMAAAQMVGGSGGPGGKFYDRDRALQSAIKCNAPEMNSSHRAACLDLAEAEEFEYSAVAEALASCNEHDARLNLGVARAFLNEVKRDLAGSNSSNWSPPDITNEVNGKDQCR